MGSRLLALRGEDNLDWGAHAASFVSVLSAFGSFEAILVETVEPACLGITDDTWQQQLEWSRKERLGNRQVNFIMVSGDNHATCKERLRSNHAKVQRTLHGHPLLEAPFGLVPLALRLRSHC